MANGTVDLNAARKVYANAIRASEAAEQWRAREITSAEDICQTAIKTAEATLMAAQEAAQKAKDKDSGQAARILKEVNEAVANGERLYNQSRIAKSSSGRRYGFPPQQSMSPRQRMQWAQTEAVAALRDMKMNISELDRVRAANARLRRWLIIGASAMAVGLCVLGLIVIVVLHK